MIKLFNGDCISVMKDLPDNSINCIITSPPYWKGFEYEAYFNSYSQYLDWSLLWLKEVKRVLKNDGTFFLNLINDSEITVRAYELLEIATKKVMFKLHDSIIWYRYNQQPANTNRQLTNQYEFLFMMRHTSANINLNKQELYLKKPYLFKTKNVGNVWELPFNSGKKNIKNFGRKETKSKWGHGGFPVDLPEACIILSTNEKDTVLDCFMGSGTTGIACINTNRSFIGIEMDDKTFDLAKNRINQAKEDM